MINIGNLLVGEGETNRLLIKNSLISECKQLQKINEASDYIEQWVGWKTPEDYAFKTLTEGNLPPGGSRERFEAKSIYLKQTCDLIGVVELYHGYPEEEVLCVGWLFIDRNYQHNGYAKEILDYISTEARRMGYKKMRAGIALKNWPALRYWYKNGFNKIMDIVGDEEHTEKTFASVILERDVV
jgi:GNAT superfamily N-acetyltransferase